MPERSHRFDERYRDRQRRRSGSRTRSKGERGRRNHSIDINSRGPIISNQHPKSTSSRKDERSARVGYNRDRIRPSISYCKSHRNVEERARTEKDREMMELERATRTIFVSNMHIKVSEKDLFILFSQKAGKVADIYIICDKHTNKSKGLAYVELDTIGSMARALGLSGSELHGQSIHVKPSEMEKNVQWTLQKQAQQGIMSSLPDSKTIMTPLPTPGVDVAAAAAAAAAKLLITTTGNLLINPAINSQEDQRQRKIYIGNLPREINELVLRNMFEPFGVVESSNVIKDPTGKSQGYGFILFREKDVVEKAIQAMNGLLIGSNILKVNYVTSSSSNQQNQQQIAPIGQAQATGILPPPVISGVDLDRVDDDDGLKINAQNRIMLMQKLASSAKVDLPKAHMPTLPVQLHGTSQQQDQHCNSPFAMVHGLLGPPSPVPTNCLILKNMFDVKEMNPDEDWALEIYEDVKTEAAKTGSVLHAFVDKNSQGYVYIKLETVDSAIQTFNMLNGRIYGGRQIHVEYQLSQMYDQIFSH